MQKVPRNLNHRLYQAREAEGWSQQDVAERIGTNRYMVCRWERGSSIPGPYYRQRLCSLFRTTPETLGFVAEMSSSSSGFPVSFTVPDLVGRISLLEQLRQRLCASPLSQLTALVGLPGVGKTALMTALMHGDDLATHFPDGVLWAGLGPEPDLAAILSGWALAVGIAPREIARHEHLPDVARIIHDHIKHRRFLMLIDDAWHIEHALLCQVGGKHCAHVLTTRFPLVAEQFAPQQTIPIEELSDEESVQLLERLAPEAVRSHPESARALAQTVGGLPLALTLIGQYLHLYEQSGQPRRLLAALDQVLSPAKRLSLQRPMPPTAYQSPLPPGTPLSLDAAIKVSVDALSPEGQSLLCLLAQFPAKPATFSEASAHAVSGRTIETFFEAMDVLLDAGLVSSAAPGRYALHQTIADYARHHADEGDRAAWSVRAVSHAVQFAQCHAQEERVLESEEDLLQLALDLAFRSGNAHAQTQLIVALSRYFRGRGRSQLIIQHLKPICQDGVVEEPLLSDASLQLAHAYRRLGRYEEAKAIAAKELERARMRGAHAQRCNALSILGIITIHQGRYAAAEQFLEEGLALARSHDLQVQLLELLTVRGSLAINQGHHLAARQSFAELLDLAHARGNASALGTALENLGVLAAYQSDYSRAEIYFQEAVALARQEHIPFRLCWALANLGVVERHLGRFDRAEHDLQEALTLAQLMQDRERVSNILINLAELAFDQEERVVARKHLRDAIEIAQTMGYQQLYCTALHLMGQILMQEGERDEAYALLGQGLAIARSVGNQWNLGRCLGSWGAAALICRDFEQAQAAYQEMLTISLALENDDLTAKARLGLGHVHHVRCSLHKEESSSGK